MKRFLRILAPALFLLLFSAVEIKAGAPPFQTPPQTVNPEAISFSSSVYKFSDSVSATIAVPQGGSYKLTVNGADPAEGNPCPNLQQGTNTINLGKYTRAGFFQVRLYQNSTSIQNPRCGEGQLVTSDNFQVQVQATKPVLTQPAPNPVLVQPQPVQVPTPNPCKSGDGVDTAVGFIPTCDLNAFARWFVGWAVGIGGGIAFLLIIVAGFRIMSSGGNPDQIKAGKEQLTAAIIGLLFIIFSVFLLQLIGVEILHLPGFGK